MRLIALRATLVATVACLVHAKLPKMVELVEYVCHRQPHMHVAEPGEDPCQYYVVGFQVAFDVCDYIYVDSIDQPQEVPGCVKRCHPKPEGCESFCSHREDPDFCMSQCKLVAKCSDEASDDSSGVVSFQSHFKDCIDKEIEKLGKPKEEVSAAAMAAPAPTPGFAAAPVAVAASSPVAAMMNSAMMNSIGMGALQLRRSGHKVVHLSFKQPSAIPVSSASFGTGAGAPAPVPMSVMLHAKRKAGARSHVTSISGSYAPAVAPAPALAASPGLLVDDEHLNSPHYQFPEECEISADPNDIEGMFDLANVTYIVKGLPPTYQAATLAYGAPGPAAGPSSATEFLTEVSRQAIIWQNSQLPPDNVMFTHPEYPPHSVELPNLTAYGEFSIDLSHIHDIEPLAAGDLGDMAIPGMPAAAASAALAAAPGATGAAAPAAEPALPPSAAADYPPLAPPPGAPAPVAAPPPAMLLGLRRTLQRKTRTPDGQ